MVSTRNGASGVNARLKIQFIIAAENRDAIQGEFFEELDVILNQGKTSVILEAWYLDEINEGAVKPILKQCGVDAYNYFGSSRSPQELIIYPLVRDHPILNEPVPITDYKIADYWPYEDLGDLMYLNGLGDAQFILGRKDRNPEEEEVLTTCMNNRLLLLTLNTHNYMDETLVPLWMNMIDFALETHFGG